MDRRSFILSSAIGGAGFALLGARPAAAGHSVNNNVPYGGVNTHFTYFNTPYGDAAKAVDKAKRLHTKLARDGLAIGQSSGWYDRVYSALRHLYDDGSGRPKTKLVLIGGKPGESISAHLDVIAPLVDAGICIAVEGANEWDINGGSDWVSELQAHQKELYRQVKSRWPGLTVIGPALAFSKSNGPKLGDLSDFMGVGNMHFYCTTAGIDLNYLNDSIAGARAVCGTKPLISTESNCIIGDGYPGTEQDQADYFARLALLLGDRGVHRVMCYELLNGSKPSLAASHRENNLGCWRADYSVKPLAYKVYDLNKLG